jgi:hypothetical protein
VRARDDWALIRAAGLGYSAIVRELTA